MAAFGAAGAGAALSPLLSGFGSSMLINSLLSNQTSSQFSLPNLTNPSINSVAPTSLSSTPSVNESTPSLHQSTLSSQPSHGMLPFAAAAAAAGAAASFSDPRVLSQYSAALSALPSTPSAVTPSSLFNILSSPNQGAVEDSKIGRNLMSEIGSGVGGGKEDANSIMKDINSKTSSIADLRMKAKKHQEAMGIEDRN